MAEQGSEEWHEDRRATITASRMGDILAGDKTKRHRLYLRELELEKAGAPLFVDDAPWFKPGKLHEDEAADKYSFEYDVDLLKVGMIRHHEYPFIGASPDRLIHDSDGGVEIKCSTSMKAHINSVKGMPAAHRPQVQGCMWVTGRPWWVYINYHIPSKHLIVHRIARDDDYINRLEARCLEVAKRIKL